MMTGSPRTAERSNAHNTWVLPDHKIVFTHLAKNACTSLKWLIAELTEQRPEQFDRVLSAEATRRMLIHHRYRWKDISSLRKTAPAVKAQISPENGWFVFAVVRDPRLRAFSAWQSKFLVADPVYTGRKFAGADWLPGVPREPEDVVRGFTRFVEVLADPDGPIRDTHFGQQTTRLHEDRIPYSRIYDISEISELLADLTAHLDRVGRPARLQLGRENDTPLSAAGAVFAAGVKEALDDVYRQDLKRFGSRWDFSAVLARPVTWTESDFRDIAARRNLGERIADLHALGKDERARNKELRRRVAELEQAASERSTWRRWWTRMTTGRRPGV